MLSRPEILVDRSLGLLAVPAVFREAGYVVRTLDDVFGPVPIEDVTWIIEADDRGWAVACKDDRIRRRPLEKQALYNSHLRVLCLTDGHLRREEQAERFRANMEGFDRLWRRPGPWVYGVHADRVEHLRIYPGSH